MKPGYPISISEICDDGFVCTVPDATILADHGNADTVERRIAKWANEAAPDQGAYIAEWLNDYGIVNRYVFRIEHEITTTVKVLTF